MLEEYRFLSFICFLSKILFLLLFMKGDFDPTKTKVLHFAGNPLALSRKLHAQEMDKLRDENEDLRRRIKALEQHGSESSVVQTLPSGIESGNDEQMQG